MVSARLALTAGDFDAYGVEKANSSASARPRLALKQRALGWARSVVARLAELGLPVEVGSDESPSLQGKKRVDCQWIWFRRDAPAREELERVLDAGRSFSATQDGHDRHAFLALRLDAAGVEVCFSVPVGAKLDLENLRARLADEAAAAELFAALEALPDEFTIGADARSAVPCSQASAELLLAPAVWIGWRVAKDTAVEHAELLDDQLEDSLVALAPLYRLVTWTRDNDFIGLEERIAGARRDRARAHADAKEKNARWLEERARARAIAPPGGSAVSLSTGGSVEKGARVRVRSGPFADKVGTVSEVDGRGAVRVMLGLLSSRFDLAELEPIAPGKDRPAFQSSHRRPMAQPPRKAR